MKYFPSFTIKRNKKTAHILSIIGIFLAVLDVDFLLAIFGWGLTVLLFDIANFIGIILFPFGLVLALMILILAMYHYGEKLIWLYIISEILLVGIPLDFFIGKLCFHPGATLSYAFGIL